MMMSRPFQNLHRHKLPVNPLYYNVLHLVACLTVAFPKTFQNLNPSGYLQKAKSARVIRKVPIRGNPG